MMERRHRETSSMCELAYRDQQEGIETWKETWHPTRESFIDVVDGSGLRCRGDILSRVEVPAH